MARKAYDLMPNNASIADTYGWILVQNGDAKGALSILQQALLTTPAGSSDYMEIGYHVAVAMNQAGRPGDAANLLRRLLESGVKFPAAGEAKALFDSINR
jgi:Tfp pilus assembly protein PilF